MRRDPWCYLSLVRVSHRDTFHVLSFCADGFGPGVNLNWHSNLDVRLAVHLPVAEALLNRLQLLVTLAYFKKYQDVSSGAEARRQRADYVGAEAPTP